MIINGNIKRIFFDIINKILESLMLTNSKIYRPNNKDNKAVKNENKKNEI